MGLLWNDFMASLGARPKNWKELEERNKWCVKEAIEKSRTALWFVMANIVQGYID